MAVGSGVFIVAFAYFYASRIKCEAQTTALSMENRVRSQRPRGYSDQRPRPSGTRVRLCEIVCLPSADLLAVVFAAAGIVEGKEPPKWQLPNYMARLESCIRAAA